LTRSLSDNGLEPFVLTNLVHITDLHSTILGLGGYDLSKEEQLTGIKLDGIDLWSQLIQTDAEQAKADARTELLINANSDMFSKSGALRVGDYKILVNPDPQESMIYMKVKAFIQTQATEVAPEDIVNYAKAQGAKILDNKKYVYNVARNPAELDGGDSCLDKESCANLAELEEYAELVDKLSVRLESFRVASAQSSFAWQDDGVLAHPMFFSNMWTPWRDVAGDPKLVFAGLGNALASKQATEEDEEEDEGAEVMSLATSLTSVVSDAKVSEVFTALSGGGALMAIIAFTAFKAGQRRSNYVAIKDSD
jgi:hypothetical protein